MIYMTSLNSFFCIEPFIVSFWVFLFLIDSVIGEFRNGVNVFPPHFVILDVSGFPVNVIRTVTFRLGDVCYIKLNLNINR